MHLINQFTLSIIYLSLWWKKSLQKSLHCRYIIRGILEKSKNKKPLKQSVLRVLESWQWDSNPQPADYKSAAL
ncbi:MAG TPA: hypothetical protein PLS49_09645, partial [Candidatus Woesebacteria bacterium]|nr:hypothetical protein [Candidatus Woesebacteria bacterium]